MQKVEAKAGRFENIRCCFGCLQGCEGQLLAGCAGSCLVNLRVAREYENPMDMTNTPRKVMIIGGGPAGLMAAETAAKIGHDVTIVEMRDEILNDMSPLMKIALMEYLREAGIKILTGTKADSIAENSVSYTDVDGNFQSVPAETVISVFGYKAYNPLEEAARKHCDNVQVVGCAVKAGNALVGKCACGSPRGI